MANQTRTLSGEAVARAVLSRHCPPPRSRAGAAFRVPPSGVGKREKREEGAWRGEMKGKKTRKERVKRDKGNELSFFLEIVIC
jgi:hypothetical protein